MHWKDLIAATFGAADIKFASHPLDKDRALIMIKTAQEAGASKQDVAKELVWHLYDRTGDSDAPNLKSHIDEQLKAFYALWPKDQK